MTRPVGQDVVWRLRLAVRFVGAVAVVILFVAGCVPRPPASAGASGAAATAPPASGESPSGRPTGPAGPTPVPSFVRPTPLPAPTFLAYTVRSGDTLTSIARSFRTTPRSIAFWSRGEHPSLDPESATYNPDRLEVGWILLLVPDAVVDEDELPEPASASPVAPSPSGAGASPVGR